MAAEATSRWCLAATGALLAVKGWAWHRGLGWGVRLKLQRVLLGLYAACMLRACVESMIQHLTKALPHIKVVQFRAPLTRQAHMKPCWRKCESHAGASVIGFGLKLLFHAQLRYN